MEKEFVIWGYPPNSDEHSLLHTQAKTMKDAKRIIGILESEHGCTKCTVQVIDLSKPFDFVKEAGLK